MPWQAICVMQVRQKSEGHHPTVRGTAEPNFRLLKSSPVVNEEMVRGTGFEPVTPTMSR